MKKRFNLRMKRPHRLSPILKIDGKDGALYRSIYDGRNAHWNRWRASTRLSTSKIHADRYVKFAGDYRRIRLVHVNEPLPDLPGTEYKEYGAVVLAIFRNTACTFCPPPRRAFAARSEGFRSGRWHRRRGGAGSAGDDHGDSKAEDHEGHAHSPRFPHRRLEEPS